MSYQVGYWTDLRHVSATKLSDTDEMVSTFMAMPYGEYEHPVYGKIKLTAEKAANMVKNILNKVRGTDLDIDYDHKEKDGRAAGWVQNAEARQNGLYLTVKWTKAAWEAIKAGEYRYFSPEFHDEWTHPKTGEVHKDVLFGGGITNRPFLKDILPLNMSELFAEQTEGNGMDPKELRKKLGLPEDATDEQVEEALTQRASGGGGQGEGGDGSGSGEGSGGDSTDSGAPQQVAASELPDEVKKLAESNPAIKALTELVTGLQHTVQTQSVALQLAETNAAVKKLSEPVNGRALPPAVQQSLQEVLLAAPKELSEKIVKFVEDLNKTGYVTLGESGSSGNHGDGDGTDATKKFNDAVQAKMTQDKLDYGTAVEQVASQNPELFEAHRQASYAFREN